MERAFRVSFEFMEQPCIALVSLNDSEGYNPALNIHYLSKEVGLILPEKKLVLSLVMV